MNDPAFKDAYTDPALTVRNPPHQVIVPTPPVVNGPAQGKTYDVAGTLYSGFSHTAAPPPAPIAWQTGRDPYANHGMIGQTFFDNPSLP